MYLINKTKQLLYVQIAFKVCLGYSWVGFHFQLCSFNWKCIFSCLNKTLISFCFWRLYNHTTKKAIGLIIKHVAVSATTPKTAWSEIGRTFTSWWVDYNKRCSLYATDLQERFMLWYTGQKLKTFLLFSCIGIMIICCSTCSHTVRDICESNFLFFLGCSKTASPGMVNYLSMSIWCWLCMNKLSVL